MSSRSHPVCQRAAAAKEEHDSAERAAIVAANLISSARMILRLDREFTEYSAQYLVDNALAEKEPMKSVGCGYLINEIDSPKTEAELEKQQQRRSKITVKDCLECAFKEGIPRYEHWAPLGWVYKLPHFASLLPRVPVKGEVIEAKELKDAFELLQHGPVGAKLHVFSPEIDLVGENGFYRGPSSNITSYVGLRDVILEATENVNGEEVGTVKICYKKKNFHISVSLSQMFTRPAQSGDESQSIEPTCLLVDFIVPRLSS